VDGGARLDDRGPANDPNAAPKCAGVRLAGRLRGDGGDTAAVWGAALAVSRAVGLKARFLGWIADCDWAPSTRGVCGCRGRRRGCR